MIQPAQNSLKEAPSSKHNPNLTLALLDRYRCPDRFAGTRLARPLSGRSGYFRYGDNTTCYGQAVSGTVAANPGGQLCDLLDDVTIDSGQLVLPFDPTQVVDNLRYERYAEPFTGSPYAAPGSLLKELYYFVRPLLPRPLRTTIQRFYFRGWDKISFPSWPLDLTVEHVLEKLLLLLMKAQGIDAIPFIWFWPNNASSASIMTHDVETTAGRDFCSRLMDIDESFGIRSSFQVVPERRYTVTPAFLDEIRLRGHEVAVQDLNHDGHLYRDRREFEVRVKAINAYGRQFGASGFRSALLYRNLSWYDQLDFEYDMSVPNIGHLEAQRGGCCTVFPYFVGDILELPVTATQDYSLFHILRQYTLDLWKIQAGLVASKHGLLGFITHPDYLREKRPQDTYRALLTFLSQRRAGDGMWLTTANEVNTWWRQRSRMTLVFQNGAWRIEGPGKDRARIAFARAAGDRIVYTRDA